MLIFEIIKVAEGYKRVLRTLYDPTLRNYFERCRRLLDRLGPTPRFTRPVVRSRMVARSGIIPTYQKTKETMK